MTPLLNWPDLGFGRSSLSGLWRRKALTEVRAVGAAAVRSKVQSVRLGEDVGGPAVAVLTQ